MYLYVVCFAQQNKSHSIPTAGYSGQSFELVLQSTNDTLLDGMLVVGVPIQACLQMVHY
jgi:hypothetical protein